jgi:quercetin dioxygenase-like cupin family protein
MKKFPFQQTNLDKNTMLRKFSSNVSSEELVWHRDREDREVQIISGSGWKFQKENSLPVDMITGDKILIKKNEWHRVIKGSGDLIVKVNVIK